MVQVDLPEALITKLRVLRMLTNRNPSEIIPMLEELVNHKIGDLLGLGDRPAPKNPKVSAVETSVPSELATGLGETIPEEEQDKEDISAALREMGETTSASAASVSEIEEDMVVSEPTKEAKAIAPKMSEEDAMAYLTGTPSVSVPKRRGAKVSLMSDSEIDSEA